MMPQGIPGDFGLTRNSQQSYPSSIVGVSQKWSVIVAFGHATHSLNVSNISRAWVGIVGK